MADDQTQGANRADTTQPKETRRQKQNRRRDERRKKRTPEQMAAELRRERLLRYFVSEGTVAAMEEAVYDTCPDLDFRDGDRIITDIFARHLDEYPGDETKRLEFRAWAVEQVIRLAQLTAAVKAMFPALIAEAFTVTGYDAPCYEYSLQRALHVLDRFNGATSDTDALKSWAVDWSVAEMYRTIVFLEWKSDPKLQRAVNAGVWDVLRTCGDLGLFYAVENSDVSANGGVNGELVGSLVDDAWGEIMDGMEGLTQPSAVPTARRLRAKARFTAMAWKTKSLDHLSLHDTDGDFIKMEELGKLADDNTFTRRILIHPTTAKPVPLETRRCTGCNAILGSWNQHKEALCYACDHSRADQEERHRLELRLSESFRDFF